MPPEHPHQLRLPAAHAKDKTADAQVCSTSSHTMASGETVEGARSNLLMMGRDDGTVIVDLW
jgi:hypothetical protein